LLTVVVGGDVDRARGPFEIAETKGFPIEHQATRLVPVYISPRLICYALQGKKRHLPLPGYVTDNISRYE